MPDLIPGAPPGRMPRARSLLLVSVLILLVAAACLVAWSFSCSIDASTDPAFAAREHATNVAGTAPDDSFPAGVLRLDSLLEPIRARDRIPALACAVVRGDSLCALGVVGVRRAGSPERARWYDRFHIGSDMKAMTATLVASLIEEGRLRWNSTLAEIFPDLARGMRPEYRGVTIEMLMQHRSGLPDDRNIFRLLRLCGLPGSPREQRLRAMQMALAERPARAPGTRNTYANMNFTILGAVVERVTGDSWESQMRKRVFEPLGMDRAGFGAPHTPGRVDQPWGHALAGPRVFWVGSVLLPAAVHPAGNVSLSMSDWGKFAAIHLEAERGCCRLLSRDSFRRLHAETLPGSHFAAGWGVACDDTLGTLLEHAGSDGFWYAVILIAPRLDEAILTAANIGPARGEKACFDALRLALRLGMARNGTTLSAGSSTRAGSSPRGSRPH